MKILVLFLDMVRANRLNLVNNSLSVTPLDEFLKELGGTLYNNAFSSYPDTYRAIANFLSGKKSFENGCDFRIKYPKFFLREKTIFDFYVEQNYRVNLFLNQDIIPIRLLSNKNVKLFEKESLETFFNLVDISDNSITFLDIPTFHLVLDQCGYTEFCEKKAINELINNLSLIFKKFNKDIFDDIFIFSDHGFKFTKELIYQKFFNKKYLLLNEDRTQILFFHRKKNENNLKINNSLVSLSDMFYLLQSLILHKNYRIKNDYIVIEDHLNFKLQASLIEIWAIINKDSIYIRTKRDGILIDRKTRKENKGKNKKLDEILLKESIFFLQHYTTYELNGKIESEKSLKSISLYYKNNYLKKRFDILLDFIKSIKG